MGTVLAKLLLCIARCSCSPFPLITSCSYYFCFLKVKRHKGWHGSLIQQALLSGHNGAGFMPRAWDMVVKHYSPCLYRVKNTDWVRGKGQRNIHVKREKPLQAVLSSMKKWGQGEGESTWGWAGNASLKNWHSEETRSLKKWPWVE